MRSTRRRCGCCRNWPATSRSRVDHIEKQERLNYLAYYDELTGLANRSLFLERVAQYMRSAVSAEASLPLV